MLIETSNCVKYEYRVVYRRDDWRDASTNGIKIFENEHRALAYVELLKSGRPDLSPLTFIRLERRVVGPWRETK